MTTRAPSLWLHLWWWVLGTTIAVWATLAGAAYYTGHHEAEEIANGQLRSVARHWLALPTAQWPTAAPPVHDAQELVRQHPSYTTEWAVLLWVGSTLRVDAHGLNAQLPPALPPGLHKLTLPQLPGTLWRVWVQDDTANAPPRRVMVLVPERAHAGLARDIAQHIIRPALVLLPLVAVLLAWALQRGLKPLHRLSAQVSALDLNSGQHLPEERRFLEMQGTVRAINTLVQNLQDQVRRERGFASDVAHELRTPMTALVLQAQRASHSTLPDEREQALQQVEHEALRAGRILTQLLDLARAQGLNADSMVPVDLAELGARVLADHAPAAFENGRDLALQNDAPDLRVPGHPLMLELALRNLVDNALRHTPAGTQVLVRTWRTDTGFGIDVVDDGGGPQKNTSPKAPAGANLGIGLTLVRRIAHLHGAQTTTPDLTPPWNHGVRLAWPAEAAPPTPSSS